MQRILVICGLVIFLLMLLIWRIHIALTTYDVIAKFREMRPLPHHIHILYKGIRIGNIVSVKHSADFDYTLLKLRLPKNVKLPQNIIAHLMIEKRRFHDYDYIELVKPVESSDGILTAGMEIEGISMVDARNFFANQNKENLEAVRDNLYKASESLLMTIEGLNELFAILRDTVKENQQSLKRASANLDSFTKNLKDSSAKINNAISQEQLESSLGDLENSISNIESISNDFNFISGDLKKSVPMISANTQKILKNIDSISSGVASSLSQPFGGLRLIFGKSVKGCP